MPKNGRRYAPSAAWLSVAAIAYASLIPHSLEVRTSLPPGLEHGIAYGISAGLFVLGYPAISSWRIAALLFAYSGALEVLQYFSPGRHPGLGGAVWSGAGAMVGASLARLGQALMHSPAARRIPTD